jgi:myo-inositol 2-dehydrogenase / D-chiro-inositol 1-dehydrogenase
VPSRTLAAVQTRVGFIGAGAVAERHARTLAGFPDVRIIGITDVSAERAAALARQTGARSHADVGALLAADVDAAYVCVPPFAHGDVEEEVVAAGVPLFVEKPLARDLETAERVGAAIARRGLVTATGYHWRYLEGVERAAALLAAAPAQLASAAWLDKVPPPAWWVRKELSGGQTVEQTTHVLDVLVHLLGDVTQVYAAGSARRRDDTDVDDATAGVLCFASGAVATVAATSLLRTKARAGVELFSPGRRIEITETEFGIDEGEGVHTVGDGGDAKVRVDRDFIDAVQGGENRVRAPYASALRTHRVACALDCSAAERAPVDLGGA